MSIKTLKVRYIWQREYNISDVEDGGEWSKDSAVQDAFDSIIEDANNLSYDDISLEETTSSGGVNEKIDELAHAISNLKIKYSNS